MTDLNTLAHSIAYLSRSFLDTDYRYWNTKYSERTEEMRKELREKRASLNSALNDYDKLRKQQILEDAREGRK